jgi:trimeric autotransporter adhesin
MKSFLSSLRQVDRQAVAKRQPKHNAIDRALQSLTTSILIAGALVGSVEGFLNQSATAAPTRKDWCGTIWSMENLTTLEWVNPATGTTTASPGPTAQITMPSGVLARVAAIGIHKESGTIFAFDRGQASPYLPGVLYKYRFGVDTNWIAVSVTGLIGLGDTQSITGASNNLNKMTVEGNTLYITDGTGIALYSIPLNASGAVTGGATTQTYTYVGDPVGTPPHRGFLTTDPTGTVIMTGGDITTDEYGDTYNISYNNIANATGGGAAPTTTKAYFYRQDPVAKTWIYQGETGTTANFAGAAFYKGDLYVKAALQLKKVPLTRSGNLYTGWNNTLTNVGAASGTGTGSTDLTACGSPNIIITKGQQIYTDAAATTLAANQTKVQTGQYIKYIITAQNTGDAWARSANLADNLPIGTSYIPNSAILNGTNLGVATYPITGFPINSPGQPTGTIPFAPSPDTATLTFVVQVTAVAGSIQNKATIAYVDNSGLTSEVSNCTAGSLLNCGSSVSLPVEITLSGTVFEDLNYGGGAGRPLSTPTTSPRSGARVELYDSTGTFKGFTTTNASGAYLFDSTNITGGIVAGNYYVRVVNNTVTSSRPGAVSTLLPIQTFRTIASTGTAAADTSRVGGEKPSVADTGAAATGAKLSTTNFTFSTAGGSATLGGQAESITPVTVGTSAVNGIDFGYNFDTIVNTNDSGQGSLRQFITNSNTLTNTGLAQVGQTAGKEVSIFMVPSGSATPLAGLRAGLTTQFTGNVAIIRSLTTLPTITDANTSIDGTTQTTYVGDTNAQTFGYVGKVGTGADGIAGNADDPTLSGVAAPEVEIIGLKTAANALSISGNNFTLRSVSVHGSQTGSTQGAVIFSGSSGFTVDKAYIGFSAAQFTAPPTSESNGVHGVEVRQTASNISIQNSIVAYNGGSGIVMDNATYTNVTINENESAYNGVLDGTKKQEADGISIKNTTGTSITQNYLHDNSAYGLQSYQDTNQDISNNTIASNGLLNTETSGIALWSDTGDKIVHNLIYSNKGDGIFAGKHPFNSGALAATNQISQNSIYSNGQLGINLVGPNEPADYISGSALPVTPNDGTTGNTFANNGMDYPIITSSVLSGTTLTVKGYVGGLGTNNAIFAGANLEFFIAAANTNDFGQVFSTGSTATKLHGEGQTYLNGATVCTTDATGAFNCALTGVSATLDPYNITATATKSGNTSEFSSVSSPGANVLLVKRITAINGTSITGVVHEFATGGNDRNPNWPSATHLQGAIDGGKVQTNDVIEYTIYFLNTGGRDAKTARVCDDIKPNQAFQPDKYATGKGITVQMGNTATTLTNTNDPTTDRGQYIAVGGTFPTNCGLTTTNPAIVVDLAGSAGTPSLTAVPFATGAGAPLNSYGFVRFTTKVGP